MNAANFSLTICLLLPSVGLTQGVFLGTWRPDPERPSYPMATESLSLNAGSYNCERCKPPYTIPADGRDHAVIGNPFYDSMRVSVMDDRHLILVGKKNGTAVLETKMSVSADDRTLTEVQTITGMMPVPIEMTRTSARASVGPVGSHSISGGWQWIDTVISSNSEDTTYTMKDDMLSMSDHMGRSFTAKLDGTIAHYDGDPEMTQVSLKLLDARTLEETGLKDGKPVKISRWSIDPDGTTIHARFDDTRGHIQTQTGHKVQ